MNTRLNFSQQRYDPYGTMPGIRDTVWSVEGDIQTADNSVLQLEYGRSDSTRDGGVTDDAYRIDLDGWTQRQVYYYLDKRHAGADYYGYWRDVDYTAGTVSFPIYDRLRGRTSYSLWKSNIELPPEKSYGDWASTIPCPRIGLYPLITITTMIGTGSPRRPSTIRRTQSGSVWAGARITIATSLSYNGLTAQIFLAAPKSGCIVTMSSPRTIPSRPHFLVSSPGWATTSPSSPATCWRAGSATEPQQGGNRKTICLCTCGMRNTITTPRYAPRIAT